MMIPMSGPDLTEVEIEAVTSVLRTPCLSIGPRLVEFEERFAAFVGARYGIGVSSGTAGLHLCVIASGVGEGDLVITTPFSFVASANALLYERAIPIFVDVNEADGNIDGSLVAEAAEDLRRGGRFAQRWLPPSWDISPAGRFAGILPVHVFGQPADMDSLLDTAQRFDVPIIEDACEAVGSAYKGRRVGTFGRAAVFAFYPNKQMTTGEGGMIVTSDPEWNDRFRSLRNQGRDIFDAWLTHSRLGYNYRLSELGAALGVAQVSRLDALLCQRARVAGWYNQRLSGQDAVRIWSVAKTTTTMSWFIYVVRLAEGVARDRVMAELEKRGIPSRPYFSPIHLQPLYVQRFGYKPGRYPVAEALGASCLALPFSGVMTETQVDYVCQNLIEVVHHCGDHRGALAR
ncbi:MAG TPA: DegT/DnrJ/EryC1/StrS family aminotransferase [Nitrospiria bacterium]|nr:DegT/DnrJ/EryC1/StrS family aminotransferase [Nitrospiria bacterium]